MTDAILQYFILGAMCIDMAIILFIGKDFLWRGRWDIWYCC